MMKFSSVKSFNVLALGASLLVLQGCVMDKELIPTRQAPTTGYQLAQQINPDHRASKPRNLAAKGLSALDAGQLDDALMYFNQALQLKVTDSTLNFLAGLTYHLMALQGDGSKYVLAEEGYKLAIKFDPSNWQAYFQAGLLALDQRDFNKAQARFSEALIYNFTDPDLMYSMLVASYYAGDVPTAGAMRDRLKAFEPDSQRFLKASAMISAALNDEAQATFDMAQLAEMTTGQPYLKSLKQRLSDWRSFHKNAVNMERAQPTLTEEVPPASAPVEVDENAMVIVDVTIIRTQEIHTRSQGVNLLNGLTLQFGDGTGTGTSGLSFKTGISKVVGSSTQTITRAINIPAITYSLNIANANHARNEILSRPTLTATNGAVSNFFSGIHIQAATLPSGGSGSGGDSITLNDEIGVGLSVSPIMLEDGRVKLDVKAERKFLNTPSSTYTGFTSKLEATRTSVDATVVMNYGETLILSGLSSRELERSRDGVPLLQDIPVVQYLFSKRTSQEYTKSVLILLTPRQPAYAYRERQVEHETPELTELRLRHMDWFKPYPTLASVFNHMNYNRYYRELRTGDIDLEHWENHWGFQSRMKKVLDLLYY